MMMKHSHDIIDIMMKTRVLTSMLMTGIIMIGCMIPMQSAYAEDLTNMPLCKDMAVAGSSTECKNVITLNCGKTSEQNGEAYVKHGEPLGEFEPHALNGYRFIGWYADPDYKTPFDFAASVYNDFIMYALYERDYNLGELSTVKMLVNGAIVSTPHQGAVSVPHDATVDLTGIPNGWHVEHSTNGSTEIFKVIADDGSLSTKYVFERQPTPAETIIESNENTDEQKEQEEKEKQEQEEKEKVEQEKREKEQQEAENKKKQQEQDKKDAQPREQALVQQEQDRKSTSFRMIMIIAGVAASIGIILLLILIIRAVKRPIDTGDDNNGRNDNAHLSVPSTPVDIGLQPTMPLNDNESWNNGFSDAFMTALNSMQESKLLSSPTANHVMEPAVNGNTGNIESNDNTVIKPESSPQDEETVILPESQDDKATMTMPQPDETVSFNPLADA